MELVYMVDLKSIALGHVGSTPTGRTKLCAIGLTGKGKILLRSTMQVRICDLLVQYQATSTMLNDYCIVETTKPFAPDIDLLSRS